MTPEMLERGELILLTFGCWIVFTVVMTLVIFGYVVVSKLLIDWAFKHKIFP